MAQTYNQLTDRLAGIIFQNQCLYAVLFLMRYIRDESPATPNHEARLNWMKNGMANPFALARNMANFAISDPACTGDIVPTDDQVKAAIEALVNLYTE